MEYWKNTFRPKLTWLDPFQWKWAQKGELSKLLGIIYGQALEVTNIDNFLINKIWKKITYMELSHLLLA